MNRFFRVGVLASALWLMAPGVQAQSPEITVLDLNRQAMAAYTNLELEQARQLLDQALATATRSRVSPRTLARTYSNLGILMVGGYQETTQGLEYFRLALRADATIDIDVMVATPEIQQVFALARASVGSSAGSNANANTNTNTNTNPPPPPPPPPPPVPVGPRPIPHQPVAEQLAQTAVPIFVEAPASAPIGSITVHYKGFGMPEFREASMRRMQGGWGYEIPCRDVYEPAMQYYIVARGRDGEVMGFVANEEQPVRVNIVRTRTRPAASLPGMPPPQPCVERECPPGLEGCNSGGGRAGLGDTCSETSDCSGALICEDNFCVTTDAPDAPEYEDEEDESDPTGMPRFFSHIGLTIGAGYATQNMLADGDPPNTVDPNNSAWVRAGQPGCEGAAIPDGSYCVQVATPGFVPTLALRATFGYYILDRLALAASVRFQFNAGESALASLLISGRVQYLFTDPAPEGLNMAAYVGSGVGQIQLQVTQPQPPEPYSLSGLNSVQVGAVLGYRFSRNVGIVATPELHVLFPTFLVAIDVTAGLELSF